MSRALFAFCAALLVSGVQAQTYPTRPIKVVVPYTPGTGIDILARTIGQKMAAGLGQAIVVENQPGASGTIATKRTAQAKPDGYTLLMIAPGHVINPHVYKANSGYDPFKDFTPITMTAYGRLLLVVNAGTKIADVKTLVSQAKAKPGGMDYASPGAGTPHHLAMELFKDMADIDILHVPFSGTAGAVTGILSGSVPAMFLPIHVAMPHVRAGKLTVLGIGSGKRSASAPDIPTLAEQGFPGAEVDMWYGLLAPAGVPQDILRSVHSVAVAALKGPDVREMLEKQGLEPTTSTPEEFGVLMQQESRKWGQVVRKAGIKVSLAMPRLALKQ